MTAATIICSSCSIASVAGASVEGIQAEDCHVSTNDVCCVHCTRQETFKVAASDDKLMMRQKANKAEMSQFKKLWANLAKVPKTSKQNA